MAFCSANLSRRRFLQTSAAAAMAAGLPLTHAAPAKTPPSKQRRKKVIIIGLDGMDPNLASQLMHAGKLPNFDSLRRRGGFSNLTTSIPPQSPVAWANFINGAGPGSHGIFDFIHRNPQKQCLPTFSVADTVSGSGYWNLGRYKVQLNFWPFGHEPPKTVLNRQGTPFWHYLDKQGIPSVFYDLPSNYPPSPSEYGNHKCLAGLGTPDLLGTYGTYQHFAENNPVRPTEVGGGRKVMLVFENHTASATLIGPTNTFLRKPSPSTINFLVHRDIDTDAAVIEIQNQKILLEKGQWSPWIKLDFNLVKPALNKKISAICRFYLQQVSPTFRLYVSPMNTDPSDPALKITEPPEFIEQISDNLGLFYTTGFQEDHKALSTGVFTDAEYARQAEIVLAERLDLLDYALKNYEDGLLFFYFSSTDLQSHMFWWDSQLSHPTRSPKKAAHYFDKIKKLYQRMDSVVGDILKRYGGDATIIVMSDHGFANFKWQFDTNRWLRENGYIQPPDATSLLTDVDWSRTTAYAIGINSLYLNLKGREHHGIVEPGPQRTRLLKQIKANLQSVTDADGRRVIHCAHRTDKTYSGSARALAPDIVLGYARDFRASWATCLGGIDKKILQPNHSAWSADHCADVSQVPGVLFSNRPIAAEKPALTDIAPSVLNEFGLKTPASMTGKNVFKT